MAGAEGFEPPKTVLETVGLPLSLRPWVATGTSAREPRPSSGRPFAGSPKLARAFGLLHFAMIRVLAALPAELAELETFGRGLAVLGRRVILILAHSALELTNFARHELFLSVYPAESLPGLVRVRARISAGSSHHPPKYIRAKTYRISVIVPAPTVRPPSRIAKRRPFSMATGVISSISSVTLSPGITISTPSGNFATPVTSVVRK